jgi:NAD(P)H-hydrate epimerase
MHKGEAGRIFCVAGSVGMVGAAALCSRSALRAGAGLVRVGMPWRLAAVVAGRDPNVMTSALPETEDGTISAMAPHKILKAAEAYDVMLLGPGISTNPQTVQAVRNLLPDVKMKVVIDADGLNALALDECRCLKDYDRKSGLPVLTPHPGEMARLLGGDFDGVTLKEGDEHRMEVSVTFARKRNCVLILKGHRTVVTDGARAYVNTTGNPGMAKAGVGDVLSGVVAALLGQGFEPFDASVLGVYLHGLAGDLVRARMGEIGMLATDIIEALPEAAHRHQESA